MIRFEHVHKWYGEHQVLDDVNLHVPKGTLCILCGKSGAGKSTLLSTVNGLESIDKGSIFVDGVQVTSTMKGLQALRMQIGMVFQDYNLFLHMTIERNIRLGLEKALRLNKKEAIWRTDKYLDRVGLLEKKNAYPAELSGGQQQRVAIARCLAMQTKSLILDEPTSALDMDNTAQVVETIRSLKEEGIAILLATHQVADYLAFADSFACMENGRISESGSCDSLLGPEAKEGNSTLAGWLQLQLQLQQRPQYIQAHG